MAISLDRAAREAIWILSPLPSYFSSADAATEIFRRLGYDVSPSQLAAVGADLSNLATAIDALVDQYEKFRADHEAGKAENADLLQLIDTIGHAIQNLSDLAGKLSALKLSGSFFKDLFLLLLVDYLKQEQPQLLAFLEFIGVISFTYLNAQPNGPAVAYTKTNFQWDRLVQFVQNPSEWAKNQYGWGTADFNHAIFLLRLSSIVDSFGLFGAVVELPPEIAAKFFPASTQGPSRPQGIKFPVHQEGDDEDATIEIGVMGIPVEGKQSPNQEDRGIGLIPYADGVAEGTLNVTPQLDLVYRGSAEVAGGLVVALRPKSGFDLSFSSSNVATTGKFRLELQRRPEPGTSAVVLLGEAQGLRLEAQQIFIGGGVELHNLKPDALVDAGMVGGRFVIATSDADGFLAELLPPEGIECKFDFRILWSSSKGLHFEGAAGLETTLTTNTAIGPVVLLIGFKLAQEGLSLEAAAGASIVIGPVAASIDQIGLKAFLQFKPGNFGPVDLGVGFKPPNGVGLAINAPLVVGGGYLFFDFEKEQYAGVLQLELAETIAVKAIGLITTRMPDGSKGFSLLVIITAEGFEPIELGFGFTLSGVGGLLGVNRTTAVDALRSGIKTGTIGSILFPENPVQNAPRIISDLSTVFPPARNRHVFGPMLMIDWGTPAILTMELGLVLEIPDPVRLLILGRLQVALPDENNALVLIHMDSLGVIDFGKGEVSLDATLYDSRLLSFVLTGDMALRAEFGENPSFLLSIGGWNPRFPAPAGFPSLSRLAITISSSDNARLRLESYLAITSNTLQFGARADFYFGVSAFSVAGFVSFDALFHFAPFSFIADLSANVALRAGGTVLMSIGLKLSLSGPSPWHVWGSAEFSILFFSVSISIDMTFGPAPQPVLPPAVDVQALLVAALNDARNWSSELPAGRRPLVVFRPNATAQNVLRVHPMAELVVRERIVPLDMTITKFGNAPVSGANRFSMAAVRSDNGSAIPSIEHLQDSFALAQFTDMTDDQKLSSPAFTRENSGIRFTTGEFAYSYEPALDSSITYNTLMISTNQETQKLQNYTMPAAALDAAASFGAAARAA